MTSSGPLSRGRTITSDCFGVITPSRVLPQLTVAFVDGMVVNASGAVSLGGTGGGAGAPAGAGPAGAALGVAAGVAADGGGADCAAVLVAGGATRPRASAHTTKPKTSAASAAAAMRA